MTSCGYRSRAVVIAMKEVTDERGRVVASSLVQGGQTLVFAGSGDGSAPRRDESGQPPRTVVDGTLPPLPPEGAHTSGAIAGQ